MIVKGQAEWFVWEDFGYFRCDREVQLNRRQLSPLLLLLLLLLAGRGRNPGPALVVVGGTCWDGSSFPSLALTVPALGRAPVVLSLRGAAIPALGPH